MKIAQMLLAYLHSHPSSYTLLNTGYQNVVTFALPDTLIFPGQAALFPPDRLNAFRVDADLLGHHRALVHWLATLAPAASPQPHALWLTLGQSPRAHLIGRGLL
ncbi:hypothetical protein [Lacticaseibacillus absianus]|uniref:hypothetical protein n=1 Tax=Lacticaseibacillus absianus TaxID=2729623 RepID=UPI0015CBA9C3|nr:hypothetical protein [Lacticaseibacillus absianus]